jgi:cell division protein FtsQ
LRLLVLVTAVAAIAGLVWAVLFSSLLAVRDVEVIGLSQEAALEGGAQVITAAAIPEGEPIARLDTGSATARVAALPWVDGVEVRRAWPNSIVLAVTERTPVAVVESVDPFDPDGEPIRQGVDESGVVFDPPGGLWLTDPVIRGEPQAIPEAVAVVASIPEDIGATLTKRNSRPRCWRLCCLVVPRDTTSARLGCPLLSTNEAPRIDRFSRCRVFPLA